ncbi:DUF6988 family protein [Candidatus Venteria ishoeyi]|uniref:Uncharacterized protein n=1 Tax=Candidatus Venteria ishoeyi TaxID=1899563 RepID=A0A1H6F715_9GAMM|nr:hypothetical protein [Candidatus Venteria ishoeyi]SEH05313.1 Uncharacterised protein [Candidatus Venteria ishoeyi]
MNNLIFEQSEKFASELYKLINLPLYDSSDRIITSDIACSMALEHWDATLRTLSIGLLPSGVVVHRSQFEALVRSVWLLYVATENNIAKLSKDLTIETEQSAKNMPSVVQMMAEIEKKAPPQAFDALNRFKENSWKALNSYVHAGIHPIRRHAEGYPVKLIENVTRNANGLAIVSAMQAVVLCGIQPKQKEILNLAALYPNCMPPPL